jgi:hypothetical protein
MDPVNSPNAKPDAAANPEAGSEAISESAVSSAAAYGDDLTKLLVEDDAAPAAAPVAVVAEKAADAAAAAPAATADKAATESAAQETTPATDTKTAPDATAQAVARLQQDLTAATQLIQQLAQKSDSGAALTRSEQQAAAQATRKIDSVRAALTSKKFDSFEHGQAIAESLIETDELAQADRKTLAAVVQRLNAAEQALAQTQAQNVFDALGKKYPGANVSEIWDAAIKDAAETIGADNPALQNLANKYFHQRCAGASKAAATNAAAKNQHDSKTKTAASPNPVTPGGNRVTPAATGILTAPAAVDADEAYMQQAMALVE